MLRTTTDMEYKQVKYGECHPEGKPGFLFPLAYAEIDPYNIGARRAHIVAFLKHMEPDRDRDRYHGG